MLSRRYLLLGSFCFAAIILYGSLVPFHFQSLSMGELVLQFKSVCTAPVQLGSRSDFLANVLLFVPLGFLAMGTVTFNWPRYRWVAAIPVTLACTLYGAAIECLQLLFPPRNSSLTDIVAQAIGSCFGVVLWLLAGQLFLKGADAWDRKNAGQHRAYGFLPVYVLMIIVLETAPFDFTLSPVEIVHKWRDGHVSVVPFAAFLDPARSMVTKTIWNVILFMPVGMMLGLGRVIRPVQVCFIGLVIAGGVELMQLPVLSRNFESTDILTGVFAVWLGWQLIALRHNGMSYRAFKYLLLSAWGIAVCWMNWTPFDFTFNGAGQRLHEISLVPFADYQQKHYLSAFDDLIHKLILFVILGILLSTETVRSGARWVVLLIGGSIAALIEAGQVLLPSRYPSISDVVLGAVGSLIGHLIISANHSNERNVLTLKAS